MQTRAAVLMKCLYLRNQQLALAEVSSVIELIYRSSFAEDAAWKIDAAQATVRQLRIPRLLHDDAAKLMTRTR